MGTWLRRDGRDYSPCLPPSTAIAATAAAAATSTVAITAAATATTTANSCLTFLTACRIVC